MDTFETEFKVIEVDTDDIEAGDTECCYKVSLGNTYFCEWVGSDVTNLVEGQTYKGRITVDVVPYLSPYEKDEWCMFRRIVEVYS